MHIRNENIGTKGTINNYLPEEGSTMLMEATIALFVLMGITWAAAIYAHYRREETSLPQYQARNFSLRKAA